MFFRRLHILGRGYWRKRDVSNRNPVAIHGAWGTHSFVDSEPDERVGLIKVDGRRVSWKEEMGNGFKL